MVEIIKNPIKKGENDDVSRKKSSYLVSLFYSLFRVNNNAPEIVAKIPLTQQSSISKFDNLVKMGEARRILKASAPTVRKYARMGCYKEYRFGEKLVFYDKQEILSFILGKGEING